MGSLLTNDPVALRSLMNETLFACGFEPGSRTTEEVMGVATEKPLTAVTGSSIPDFLGKNGKNYLFLINEPAHVFFAEADLGAFAKILAAKQLSIDDVAVLNCAHHNPMDLNSLITFFKPKNIVFLGADPLWAGYGELKLNVPVVAAGIYRLLTYSFGEMNLQNDKKKIFWSLIKQI